MARTRSVLVGNVLPLTDGLHTRQAVGISDGFIKSVGDRSSVISEVGDAEVIDFGNRTIMPGFIDAHTHVAATAIMADSMVDCVNTCSCITEMQEVLVESLGKAKDTGWVNARGLFINNLRWKDGRYPTRQDLDRVSKKVPIAVRTGHISILNTKALEVVEIEKFYNVVHGSGGPVAIQKGDDGRPNGRLNNLDGLLPYPEPDLSEIRDALEKGARNLYAANGVTTICEITDSRESLYALRDLIDEGRVASRFKILIRVPRTMSFEEALNWRNLGIREIPGMFEIAGVKMFADGGFSSADAAVWGQYTEKYALEPGSRGVLTFSDVDLAKILIKTAEANMQLAFHANGERSQDQVSKVWSSLDLRGAPPVRLEHAGNWVWDPKTPEAWERIGALPVPNPPFINIMAPAMREFLGEYGIQHGKLPFKSLLAQGWELPAGSDATPFYDSDASDPFFSIWCCMKRTGWDGKIIEGDEAIDLEAALKMHTIYPAKLLGEGHLKGTLEANKLADLIVLDRDISTVSADDIRNVTVDFVYRGGELVFARESAEGHGPGRL